MVSRFKITLLFENDQFKSGILRQNIVDSTKLPSYALIKHTHIQYTHTHTHTHTYAHMHTPHHCVQLE